MTLSTFSDYKDPTAAALVVVGQGLEEIVLRQSFHFRDLFFYVHLLRHSWEEAHERFNEDYYRAFRARVILTEMTAEYMSILVCPMVTIIWEQFNELLWARWRGRRRPRWRCRPRSGSARTRPPPRSG